MAHTADRSKTDYSTRSWSSPGSVYKWHYNLCGFWAKSVVFRGLRVYTSVHFVVTLPFAL